MSWVSLFLGFFCPGFLGFSGFLITIVYPVLGKTDSAASFWQLISGQVSQITVRANLHDIPPRLLGRNFSTGIESRRKLEVWINQLWQNDTLITGRIESGGAAQRYIPANASERCSTTSTFPDRTICNKEAA